MLVLRPSRLHVASACRSARAHRDIARSNLRRPFIALTLALCLIPTCRDVQARELCRLRGSVVRLALVPEASGAAVSRRSPGIVWTHNDSGEPVLFALDTLGSVQNVVRVAGARVIDWEEVAAGPCPAGACLYVADIGDNATQRRDIVIYRVPEPEPNERRTRSAEVFRAKYPDGSHDAEAIFVTHDGVVFIVTKGDTGPIALYSFPQPLRAGTIARLVRVATIAKKPQRNDWVTGAAASPDGQWVVLRTPVSLALYRTKDLTRGVVRATSTFDVRGLKEPQGEGVALANDGSMYLTGEGERKGWPGTFARVACALPP